jgi:hypothetical protein
MSYKRNLQDGEQRNNLYHQALNASGEALGIYERFGFVQVIETTSEEILFRHSQALKLTEQLADSGIFLEKAYQEMMRKAHFIPASSPFRRSYLENISIHRDIQSEYKKLRKK